MPKPFVPDLYRQMFGEEAYQAALKRGTDARTCCASRADEAHRRRVARTDTIQDVSQYSLNVCTGGAMYNKLSRERPKRDPRHSDIATVKLAVAVEPQATVPEAGRRPKCYRQDRPSNIEFWNDLQRRKREAEKMARAWEKVQVKRR